MRGFVALGLISVLFSGCGNDANENSRDSAAASAAKTPITLTTLRDTCPEIEFGLPDGTILVEPSEWVTYLEKLHRLRDTGDTEAKNVIDKLIPPVEVWANDPDQGQPTSDAVGGLIEALNTIADRCKSVGSSALQ